MVDLCSLCSLRCSISMQSSPFLFLSLAFILSRKAGWAPASVAFQDSHLEPELRKLDLDLGEGGFE
jgi:hypothetical protein